MKRGENLRAYHQDAEHQRRAGQARAAQSSNDEHCRRIAPDGWWAFSAYWRVHQGLPLLHPSQIQFLTPDDFCGPDGRPLSKRKQRCLFREYMRAATSPPHAPVPANRPSGTPYQGGDLAFIRLAHHWATSDVHPRVIYGGRDDIGPYEAESLLPTRPYTIPVSHSEGFQGYFLETAPDPEQDDVYSLDDYGGFS